MSGKPTYIKYSVPLFFSNTPQGLEELESLLKDMDDKNKQFNTFVSYRLRKYTSKDNKSIKVFFYYHKP